MDYGGALARIVEGGGGEEEEGGEGEKEGRGRAEEMVCVGDGERGGRSMERA